MTTNEQPPEPFRMWAVVAPFTKRGFPSFGNFGSSSQPVVVMTMKEWARLCEEVPQLKTTQFEVGTYE